MFRPGLESAATLQGTTPDPGKTDDHGSGAPAPTTTAGYRSPCPDHGRRRQGHVRQPSWPWMTAVLRSTCPEHGDSSRPGSGAPAPTAVLMARQHPLYSTAALMTRQLPLYSICVRELHFGEDGARYLARPRCGARRRRAADSAPGRCHACALPALVAPSVTQVNADERKKPCDDRKDKRGDARALLRIEAQRDTQACCPDRRQSISCGRLGLRAESAAHRALAAITALPGRSLESLRSSPRRSQGP